MVMIVVIVEETIGVEGERSGPRSVVPLHLMLLRRRPCLQGVGGLELARPADVSPEENMGGWSKELVEGYTIKPGW